VTLALVGTAMAMVAFAIWAIARGLRRERSSEANNWLNEDHLSRARDTTWAEGSTHSKSEPRDSSGLGL
jgi:hypothetical protein